MINKKIIICLIFIMVQKSYSQNRQADFMHKVGARPEINLVSSDNSSICYSIQINGIETFERKIGENIYQIVSIPDEDATTNTGSPQIPMITRIIAIPDCDNISISVSSSNELHFFNYDILPVPGFEKQKFPNHNEDLIHVFKKNNSVYSSCSDFPGKFAEIIETGYVREQKVARIAVYPIQYNPVSKELKVFSNFNIRLSFVNSRSPINKELGIFRNIMHNSAFNYKPSGINAITKLTGTIDKNKQSKFYTNNSFPGGVISVTDISTLIGTDAIPVDYLIITHSSLFNSASLIKLADHRKDYNGYDVAIIKVDDDVYNSYPSSYHYESIRNFIQDVYLHGKANHTGDGHLGYILLVGDAYLDDNSTEMVPAAYPPFYDKLEQAGDYYYACTGGDSDNLLDLMYGRLPVGNENELSNIVNKIISYEYNTNNNWRNNFTFVAGSYGLIYSYADLAISRIIENMPSNVTKSYAYRALDSDRPTLVTEVQSIFAQRFTQKEYDDPSKLCGAGEIRDWIYDDPIAGINNGVHTFIYEGHGSSAGLGGEGCGRQFFKVEDCISPQNNSVQNRLHNNFYTFMIFSACNTGHFDNNQNDQGDCIAEVILNLANKGAIGVVASTRNSYVDSFGFIDGKIINKEFKDSVFILGEAFMGAKLNSISNKFKRQYNLYGDPALNLRPIDYFGPGDNALSGSQDCVSHQTGKKYELYNNYPNPFNPSTKISWQSPVSSRQTLKIFNILGREITTLIDEEKPAGYSEVIWNAVNLPSGVYFYQLKAGSFSATKKLLLLK